MSLPNEISFYKGICSFKSTATPEAYEYIKSSSNIQVIEYDRTKTAEVLMDPIIMEGLCKAISQCETIIQVQFSNIVLSTEIIRNMKYLFSSESRLESLILHNCKISDSDFVILFTLILQSGPRNLHYLDLSSNKLGLQGKRKQSVNSEINIKNEEEEQNDENQEDEEEEKEKDLFDCLIPKSKKKNDNSYEEDDSNQNQVFDSTPGCKILARILVDRRISISSLNISDNPISNYGALALSQSLPYSSIRELNISNTDITTKGFLCLTNVLRFIPSLTSLDVSNNVLGHTGLSKFLNQLKYTKLQQLKLDNTLLDSYNILNLGQYLATNNTLVSLSISNNKIDGEQADSFFQLLDNNTTLRNIDCINMSNSSIHTFVSNAYKASSHKDPQKKRNIKCLKNDDVKIYTPYMYLVFRNWIIPGFIYTLINVGLSIFNYYSDISNILEYLNDEEYIYALLTAIIFFINNIIGMIVKIYDLLHKERLTWNAWFVPLYFLGIGSWIDQLIILWRTHGNWDEDKETDSVYVDSSLFERIEKVTFFTSTVLPAFVQGYAFLVAHASESFFVIAKFVLSVISLAWSSADALNSVEEDDKTIYGEHLDGDIFWNIRLFLYCLPSLASALFRIAFILSISLKNLILNLILELLVWYFFLLIRMAPQKENYMLSLIHPAKYLLYLVMFNSDIVFTSARSINDFYHYFHYIPRFVFIIMDFIMWVARSIVLFLHLLVNSGNLRWFVTAAVILVLTLDLFFMFLRCFIEQNGIVYNRAIREVDIKKKKKKKGDGDDQEDGEEEDDSDKQDESDSDTDDSDSSSSFSEDED